MDKLLGAFLWIEGRHSSNLPCLVISDVSVVAFWIRIKLPFLYLDELAFWNVCLTRHVSAEGIQLLFWRSLSFVFGQADSHFASHAFSEGLVVTLIKEERVNAVDLSNSFKDQFSFCESTLHDQVFGRLWDENDDHNEAEDLQDEAKKLIAEPVFGNELEVDSCHQGDCTL